MMIEVGKVVEAKDVDDGLVPKAAASIAAPHPVELEQHEAQHAGQR